MDARAVPADPRAREGVRELDVRPQASRCPPALGDLEDGPRVDVRRQPWRVNAFGLPPSMDHSWGAPFWSGTMIWTQMCGLVHCTCLTVPTSVFVCAWSNIAKE